MRLKPNIKFENQFIVPAIKFRNCFSKLMNPITLLEKLAVIHLFRALKKCKLAMNMKLCHQKENPTPETEGERTKWTIRYLL